MKTNWLCGILLLIAITAPASAGGINNGSFENGLDGWTIQSGTLDFRVSSQASSTSNGVTALPTNGDFLLKIAGGSSTTFLGGDQYASVLSHDDAISVSSGQYLLMSIGLAGRDIPPRSDWLGIGIDGLVYKIIETGNYPIDTSSGWMTLAIRFQNSGSFHLDLLGVNDQVGAGTSYFYFDNVRIADSLPPVQINSPLIEPLNPITVAPIAAVPEPETYTMILLGLMGIAFARRQNMTSRS